MSAQPKIIAPNVFQQNTLKMASVFLVDSWRNVWSVMLQKISQNAPNALMIDTISTNIKPALLAMSSMTDVLNAHLKITALNVSQTLSTFKITSVEVALSLMASVCNAQLQNIALNAYPTNTTSMILPSIVLPANQPWKDAPPVKINKNAQSALLLTSSIVNKHARNAYQY